MTGTCCGGVSPELPRGTPRIEPGFVAQIEHGRAHFDLLVPGMHCAACMAAIERGLTRLPGVAHARANLTTHRVGADFDPGRITPDEILASVEALGYGARPFHAAAFDAAGTDSAGAELIRAMAVAGFAAANVMLLSVSVWSGADPATRDLFHWLSALIALPAITYSVRPFLRSAIAVLAAGRLNMDVPITLAVLLAAAVSLHETATGGTHAYFDAAIGLLFFLLIGRFLDHRMRGVARSAAAGLLSMAASGAMRIGADGTSSYVPVGEIEPGDRVQIAAGERVPVDGVIAEGASDIDRSMLTGEAISEPVSEGGEVFAGTINLTGSLIVTATRRAGDTLLAEIVTLMENAGRGAGRFVRIAERAARIYAPAVHLLAVATLVGWLAAGAGWHTAIVTAVAVLIITCPCALGLAVPAVQVTACGRLLKGGIIVKDGAALERLASIDTVVLDKTGTLTLGRPRLVDAPDATSRAWPLAAAFASASRHPLASALAEASRQRGIAPAELSAVAERPGSGLEADLGGGRMARFGRGEWVGAPVTPDGRPEIWLGLDNAAPVRFAFEDEIRDDAAETVSAFQDAGLDVHLVSGDHPASVEAAAMRAGIRSWRAATLPADKAAYLAGLTAAGRTVLMVGDGINDAPALASAAVSMSPASGSDISQAAASIVFSGEQLAPVVIAYETARAARRLVMQNIALAVGYNLIAVPVAIAGLATPLIAAIAMSSSSILVTANALRLAWKPHGRNPISAPHRTAPARKAAA